MQYNILIFLYLNEDQHQAIVAIPAISSFIFIKNSQPQLSKKILFQGGIDLTLVGPTDIGNSEKSAKTTTKAEAKEPAGVPGGAVWPPQAQAGSE